MWQIIFCYTSAMPELPEVETSRRGITPHIVDKKIAQIILRHSKLRWPIPKDITQIFSAQYIEQIQRRGKYLLLITPVGTLILHLGMSGSLRIVKNDAPAQKHDHVDIVFTHGISLRFTDPRRFGCLLWTNADPMQHPLLKHLGVEPLSKAFNVSYLFQQTRKRKLTSKQLLMNSHIIVGVGNIYASEALFAAGIRPTKIAARLTKTQCQALVNAIKKILRRAINAGGTTLSDFTQSDGKPGYFKQKLQIYGRTGEPCYQCQTPIKEKTIAARNSFYCPQCQK